MALPPINQQIYNQQLFGLAGEFGKGGNAQIFYLQTGILPADLDKITLISDIAGTQTWPVRDLFQRDVDTERVTNSILPYFQDETKLKFFNPLTLTLIPASVEQESFVETLPRLSWFTKEFDGHSYRVLEMPGMFRYRYPEGQPAWAMMEWNDTKIKIVAIDGQHRLSALKRFHADIRMNGQDNSDFSQWTIPAVIFSVRALDDSNIEQRILDVIRNVFIYINTQAQTISETRQILLDDESVVRVATQEFLQYSHENDVLPDSERDLSRLPLLCFDWRGQTKNLANHTCNPGSLKSTEEIALWFEHYILGEDFSPEQEEVFGITPVDALKRSFERGALTPTDSKEIRRRFRGNILPGVSILLQNFNPYKDYIIKIRELEEAYNEQSDIARAAFHKLRFGDDPAHDTLSAEVRAIEEEIVQELMDCQRQCVPEIFYRDIGMRGLVGAYGLLRKQYGLFTDQEFDWEAYSEWYTKYFNKSLSGASWYGLVQVDRAGYLKHIAYDHNDKVVNYRPQDVMKGLALYMSYIVSAYAYQDGGFPEELWESWSPMIFERLYDTVEKGCTREARVLLKDEYALRPASELTAAAKAAGTDMAEKWKQLFENEVNSQIFL